jgi:hypothetical protein
MSDDIEQRLRTELQRLFDQNPNLEPVQFIESNQIVTVSVADGIPQVARSDCTATTQYGCPQISELHGTPAYHIYNLMQTLQCLDEERLQQGAAHMLTLAPVEELEKAQLENPRAPSPIEIANSTLQGSASLRTQPADNGMVHHLELLQQKLQEALAQQPELEALILRTAKGAVEIRVANRKLCIAPSPLQGRPYMEVYETPQVRLYLLHNTIQGLETALYGGSNPIEVKRSAHRNKAEENLVRHFQNLQCDKLVVSIRRSRKSLFISGSARELTYLPLRVRIVGERLCVEEQVQNEPSGHVRIEYRALPAEIKQLANAFFAYLSSRMSNGSCKH